MLNLARCVGRVVQLVVHAHTVVVVRPHPVPELVVPLAVHCPRAIDAPPPLRLGAKLFQCHVRLQERHCCVVALSELVRTRPLNRFWPSLSDKFKNLLWEGGEVRNVNTSNVMM